MRSREGRLSRPHRENISSSACAGTTFSLLRVCAKKKPLFAPPASDFSTAFVVGVSRGIQHALQLNGNGMETERNDSERQTERNGTVLETFF